MWSKQQVAVVISFIVTNCFIQISCNIISNTSSAELIDNIGGVDDSNSNHDKTQKYIEVEVPSKLSSSSELQNTQGDDFECYCVADDEDCFLRCLNEDNRDDDFGNMFLLTAGEVLLGTAIVMGLSALVTLLLRACTRSRIQRNRRDVSDFLDVFERNSNRASLTSLQQTVISKLRDRPPRYETRHNYAYQNREDSSADENANHASQTSSIHNVAVLNPNANRSTEPPPAYEPVEDANSVHELPPAYTISLPESDDNGNSRGENQTDCVGGITNQSFTCDDNQQSQQQQHRSDDMENDNRHNSVPHRTCESILYI